MSDVTRLLEAAGNGDARAQADLLPLVYEELRRLARRQLAREQPGQTLQPTALVHEAYLRLVGDANARWDCRAHFFTAAVEAMRRIMIENARRKKAVKHGGGRRRVELDHDAPDGSSSSLDDVERLLALDEAIDRLSKQDPDKAQLVKLRCFAGLSVEEAGAAMGMSRSTANRHWAAVRDWLRQILEGAAIS